MFRSSVSPLSGSTIIAVIECDVTQAIERFTDDFRYSLPEGVTRH